MDDIFADIDQGPRENPEPNQKLAALSVSAALAQAKTALEQCVVTLVGEVSEISNKVGYKAVYFTVKDEKSSLPCMMWMSRFNAMGVTVQVGSLVELSGRFTLYAPKGRMSFEVFTLKLAGEGNLRMQVANLARKLEAEGLMAPERKRKPPKYPTSIGLVTSPRGAAVHDVLRTLRRRFPLAEVHLAGVPVEGRDAPRYLAEGLALVSASGVEVVLLVRGGGSFEDLMPFNDEMLARAIAANPVPVVTGIGHEPDTCIADMVADLRASTPTAAAEAISPKLENLNTGFDNATNRMNRALLQSVSIMSSQLDSLASHPVLADSQALLSQEWQTIDLFQDRIQRAIPQNLARDKSSLTNWEALLTRFASRVGDAETKQMENLVLRLEHGMDALLSAKDAQIGLNASRLNDLSPLTVLSRGYAIARDADMRVVRSKEDVTTGDAMFVRVSDGDIACVVTE